MARILGWSLLFAASATWAVEPHSPAALVAEIGRPEVFAYPVGVTADRTSVAAVVHDEDFDYDTPKTRILLVGQSEAAARSIGRALAWFYRSDEATALRDDFLLSAVPHASPGRPAAERLAFPPPGVAYADPTAPEGQYLWRWIGMAAPDLVVEVRPGAAAGWFVPRAAGLPQDKLAAALTPAVPGDERELAAALVSAAPCETGRIAAVRATVRGEEPLWLPRLLAALRAAEFHGPSPARRELQSRLHRTPLEVARQLSQHYGQALPQVVYIPAMALVGRLRLGELTQDPSHLAEVRRIAAPYFDGARATDLDNGSALAGHLIFAELAERTDGEARARYVALARRAADLAFEANGALRASMPHHAEMSDALFMGGPILAHVGALTGDPRYFDACRSHLQFMRRLVLRDDGLYRHSPLDEAAWGRGNGFPALGLALCLTHWPADRADRGELAAMFRSHVAALQPHQDRSGCWRQVIDRPDSYRELSCTCMIAFAVARGVQEGWLDRAEYDPLLQNAWRAIRVRVAANGRLADVCTGTGRQPSLDDYYRRPALLGPDDRGGAMALLAATEMASYSQAP